MLALSLRADRSATIALFLLITVAAATVPLSAMSVGLLVDASRSGAGEQLGWAVTLTAVAYAVQFVINRIEFNLQEDMSHKVELVLSEELLRAVAAPRMLEAFWEPGFLDSLEALRRNIYPLANYLWRVTETLLSLAGIAFSLWLLIDVSPLLALLALASAAPLATASLGQRIIRAAARRGAEQLRLEKMIHQTATSAAAIKEIMVSGAGPVLDARARQLWDDDASARAIARARAGAVTVGGWAIFAAALAVSLDYATRLAASGVAAVGSIAVILTLSTRLKNQVSQALYGLTSVSESTELAEHFDRIHARLGAAPPAGTMELPPQVSDGLRLRDVIFTYPGQAAPALAKVSLDIPAGATVSVVGLNGAGKTTLISLLLGLTQPASGSISIDGHDLAAASPAAVARGAAAFQDYVRPLFTAREAIGLGQPSAITDTPAIMTAARRAQAATVIDQLPSGLATALGTQLGGTELSQGQWQRIALARGLMNPAPLILAFDEPTSALDPQAEHDLFALLMRHTRDLGRRYGTITFYVSHRFTSTSLADYIIVLDQGQITEHGTHHELLAAAGTYSQLFRLQQAGYS